jgi:type 1 fimbria pilin
MRMKVWMKLQTVLIALTVLLMAGVAMEQVAMAQNVGSVRGTVTDPSAAVVPNAKVVATGNGVTRTVNSDGQGRYTLPNMPPGKYNIRADAQGFVTFVKPDVDVPAGQASSLDIALQIAAEAAQVSVNDQSAAALSLDSSSNVSALVLKDADIDALPDDPDDLQSDLEALAGPAAGPNGAQFFIDGFSGGQLPPKSSIREIRINSNPFSSEFDAPGFGRIEILTRPGTDNYHGQVSVNYGNEIFDSRNPLLTTKEPPYNSTQLGANFGGPINKKSSFFLDYQRRAINEDALINAVVLDSSFNQIPYNAAYRTPNALWRINPRLDYAINQNNTLTIRYQHIQSSNFGGVGGFALPTQESESYQRTNEVQITETAVLGTVAVDETRFQFRDQHVDGTGLGDFDIPGINVSSAFNSGGAPYTANKTFNKGFELHNILTTTRGKHALKVGFRARQTDSSSLSNNNFNGSWNFLPPNPLSGLPVCANPVTSALAATSLDVYQDTELLLSQGVPMSQVLAKGCGPSQFTLSSQESTPYQAARQFDLGVFVQDDWRLMPNLTVNAGLRYETQNNIGDHLDLGPRVGLAWAPGAKGKTASKTVIRAGYGIFFTRFPVGNTLNTLRFDGFTQTNYIVTAGTPGAALALEAYPGLPLTSLLQVQNQAIYTTDKGLRTPYMGQTAIGVDRQLPGRTQLSVNYVNTRGVHVLRQRNINAPIGYIGPLDPGVRPFDGTNVPGADGDIYQYETSGLFKQTQLTINANTRFNSHFQMQGYYVFGEAHTNVNGFPMNQYNDSLDWGRAPFDSRHRGYFGGSVGLPYKLNLNPFVTMQSGLPFNIITGQQFEGDGITSSTRPYFAPCAPTTMTKFGCFSASQTPGYGLVPMDYGDGPAQFSVNLRLSRTWGWGERAGAAQNNGRGGGGGGFNPGGFGGGGRGGGFGGGGRGGGFGGGGRGGLGNFGGGNTSKRYNITATVSARNAFNHVNYASPIGVLGSPFFGESTALNLGGGAGFGGNTSAAGNRKVEFQLRFQF